MADVRDGRTEGTENWAEREQLYIVHSCFLGDATREETAVATIRKERVFREILAKFFRGCGDQVCNQFESAADHQTASFFDRNIQRLCDVVFNYFLG